ncbi:MAG: ATP-binding protein [Gemmatimonadota bacterium]|nr:ATP-binding protein [Gemmatimonadota bacterium]
MTLGVSGRSADEVQAQIHYRLLERSAAAERRYRILVEHLQDPVVQLDREGLLVFVNTAWCRAVSTPPDASLGQPLLHFVSEGDEATVRDTVASVSSLSGEESATVEVGLLYDGEAVPVSACFRRSVDGDVIASFHDLRAQKKLEEGLRAAKEAAEEANRLKSSFLANMSHEIRTPLSAVLGFAEMLGGGSLTDAERADYASRVERNGRHLLGLIDDILDFSRIESGKLEVLLEPLEVCDTVDDVVAGLADRARAKGLDLSTKWTGSAWGGRRLVSDEMRLRQILTNLLTNAVKFTERGSVSLLVHADPEEGRVRFSVRDTGMGISAERLDSVFEPFRQESQDITRRYGGAGLGLAISARLADMLGGTLTVESEVGQGTVFVLDLPLRTAARSASEEPQTTRRATAAASEEEYAGECRVLVVEDTPDLRNLMVRFVSDLGLEADTASNGMEAVDMVATSVERGVRYKSVLMDMQMPLMDGYEASRHLRAGGFDGLIIALTAYAMQGDREKCLAVGCDDYLAKPVNRAALRALFDRYCGAAEAR